MTRHALAIMFGCLLAQAQEDRAGSSYEELFMGLRRPFTKSLPAPKPGTSPEDTAKSLYGNEVFFHLRNSFPEPITDYLAPCFCKSLVAHFDTSRIDIERWFEEHKDTDLKLPMDEGAIFIGGYEGASSFLIGQSVIKGDTALVTIYLTYTEPPAVRIDWTDIAIFEKVAEKWLLTDIKFDSNTQGDWTLRKRTTINK